MITPETANRDVLAEAIRTTPDIKVEPYEHSALRVTSNGRQCFVIPVSPHHIQLLHFSRVSVERNFTRQCALEYANRVNLDHMLGLTAAVGEDQEIIFSAALPLSGGLPTSTFIQALLGFFISCGIHEQRFQAE